LARQRLQRVIDEHPDTHWHVIAQQQMGFPLAFQWQEAFMDPPDGIPLPWDKKPWEALTEQEKEAKAAYDKRKAARKKRVAESKSAGAKKRPPPKL